MVDQRAFDSNHNPCNFEYAKIYAKQNFIVSALPGEEQYKTFGLPVMMAITAPSRSLLPLGMLSAAV